MTNCDRLVLDVPEAGAKLCLGRNASYAAAKRGDILAASLTLSGKTHLLYRFETTEGEVEYFNPRGESAKSMLMKTPVDGARTGHLRRQGEDCRPGGTRRRERCHRLALGEGQE